MVAWNRVMGPGHNFREAEYAEKMLTLSYNRYTRALTTALAKVQKLTARTTKANTIMPKKVIQISRADG